MDHLIQCLLGALEQRGQLLHGKRVLHAFDLVGQLHVGVILQSLTIQQYCVFAL